MACDRDVQLLSAHVSELKNIRTIPLDIADENALNSLIQNATLVVSLLPPAMHPAIAQKCLDYNCHLATASYVSPQMESMDAEAKKKDLVFLNELGLDPGIDHLSAIKMLDEVRALGGVVTSFESYCGGLVVAEDCGNNPWKYKFSWNPMNVITAGQGGMSVYRMQGTERYIPWYKLFAHSSTLQVPDYGMLDAYPNRDSLGYEKVYGLEKAETVLRGTLRRPGYCSAWQVLVDLGYTDNTTLLHKNIQSVGALTRALTGKPDDLPLADWLLEKGLISPEQKVWFAFLKLDDNTNLALEPVTSAVLLRLHLEDRWKLEKTDRDEVIMYHRIQYRLQGQLHTRESVLGIVGTDSRHTAMAKTVGLPLAMGVELILTGQVRDRGVVMPLGPQWYGPILPALEKFGINFKEYGA